MDRNVPPGVVKQAERRGPVAVVVNVGYVNAGTGVRQQVPRRQNAAVQTIVMQAAGAGSDPKRWASSGGMRTNVSSPHRQRHGSVRQVPAEAYGGGMGGERTHQQRRYGFLNGGAGWQQ